MAITRELLAQSWRSWYSYDTRRIGPEWLQLVWTVLFASTIAAAFTLLAFATRPELPWQEAATWWRWYRVNFVISLSVALCIHALFALLIRWLGPERIRRFSYGRRALFFTAVPLTGLAIGWPLGAWLVSESVGGWVRLSAESLLTSAVLALLISSVLFLFFNAMARRLDAEKRAAEAQLRLLQGQIEPHFLFNTLANVVALIDTEPGKAKQMLAAFTDYLRASLVGLRRDVGALGDELALAEAYLRVQRTRMEDRLHFVVDADATARAALLPPLLLQPLVENAVQHGLEPSLDGGTVHVRARAEGGMLVVEVHDDGLGHDAAAPPSRGHGMALANIRERLSQRYGGSASLDLVAAAPGTRARLRLPLDLPPAAKAP